MSKKFSILKEIDIDKLYNNVQKYICETGERNPYLFMCNDTVEAIAKMVIAPYMKRSERYFARSGVIGEYCGYKVFENDTLDFGEVEIR